MEDKKNEALIAKQVREKKRVDELTEGFHGEGTVKIAGHELRPFTFGSLTLCRRLKLSLFTDDGSAEEMSDDETIAQLAAFFWIQSHPIKGEGGVLSAVREGRAEQLIEEFQFDISVHELPAIMRRINELSKLASAAAVEIEKKPETGNSDEPKN